jgi:hypothetical protein
MAEEQGDLGTAYGGQHEDINDKLVLDLAWERQQKKVSILCARSSSSKRCARV